MISSGSGNGGLVNGDNSGNGGGAIGGVDSGYCGSSIGGVSHDSLGGEMLSPGSGNSGLINWNHGSVGMGDEAIERGGRRHAGGETTSNNQELHVCDARGD